MKNLTIKMKLVVSFSIVALLVLILATYSVISISKSSEGFTSYREMAKNSVLAGRVQANMLMVRLNVKDYLKTSSAKDIEEFNYYFERASKFMAKAKTEIHKPSRAHLVQQLSKDLATYKELFDQLTTLTVKQNSIVRNNLKVNGIKIEKTLISIMNQMAQNREIKIPYQVSKAINTMLLARLYTARFVIYNTKVEHDRVLSEFKTLKVKLHDIRGLIEDKNIKKQFLEAIELINTYEAGIIEVRKISIQRTNIINNSLNIIGPEIAKISEEVKLSIKKDQDEIGPEVKRLNDNINRVVLIISIIILLLVVSLAIIIPRNISTLIASFQLGLMNFFKYLNKESDKAELIEITSNDEIGQMSQTVNEGIVKVEEIITSSNHETWIKDGVNQLNQTLINLNSVEDVTKESIDFVCKYLNAGVGVLYRYKHRSKKLQQTASFAHVIRDELSNEFNMGEGVIGQVALQREPILLSNIQKDQNLITTGTVTQAAYNTYTFPLIYNDTLYGVIELGSFTKISQNDMDFLNTINEIICIALSTAVQNKRVQRLLEDTKKANTELEVNQLKLEEANTNMEEQQQQLEEANANMEEQQQQLEEANANMEEQQQQLKISEQNLKLQNQQLEDTKKDIQRKAEELAQSSKYKSEFLANMSHELRTPLNSIILLSSLLQRNSKETLNTDDIKKAKTIFDSGNELLRLINDILDLSKVESGKMHVIIDKVKSMTLLQQMKDSFEYSAIEKGLTFEIVDEYKGFIFSDKDRISQIVRNLISNAFKFTKEGSVTLKIEPSKQMGKDFRISVTDTGIGIAKQKQDLIFKAFTQADGGTSREFGGTGLGLSISRELSKLLKGSISLTSQENVGSTFSIDLPNLEVEDVNQNSEEEKTEESYEELVIPQKVESSHSTLLSNIEDDRDIISSTDEVYLVIDDDKTFAQVVYEEIKSTNQFGLIALDGNSGLELVQKYNVKGIMLDLTLPDMNGVDVLKELKSNVNTRHIPVHIISSKDKNTETLELGAIGYLQKPALEHDISQVLNSIDTFSNKKIKDLLIVEDNKVHREALIELIGEGVNITGVKSAQEAINEVKKEKYDTVVVDLGLIDSNGYEVCEYIKNTHPTLPIIIYTGKELNDHEKIKLREYSNSIIIKTANSNERILNEINLFLHRDEIEEESEEIFEAIDLQDLNILIVDDDIKNIFVLDAALKEFNATTHTAFNGQEALDFLDKNSDIDMVLMDIMMPIMNGYEAIEHIRNDEQLKDLPIIAVTAKAMKEDREKCISLGANDYLAKPINLNVLAKMIKAWSNKQ